MNALALRPGGTGVQTYIRELLRAMAGLAGWELVATVQADAVGEVPPGVTARPVPVTGGLRRALVALRSLGPADLVHGLDVDLPVRPGAPTVATVHDMTPFDVPWTMSRRKAFGERVVYRQALSRADAVIAVSAFTAERLEAWLGITATVVHEGAPTDIPSAGPDDVAAVRARYDLPERFVLHVGTLEPRKDVATVAAGCRQAGVSLVLAGRTPPQGAVPAGATALGYVDRTDLGALYGAATVVAVASRYEGFGLPPLEAMVAGAPVLAARAGALPEVLADGARFVRAGDVDGWAAAIRELAENAEARLALVEAGRRRAGALSWQTAAEGTAAVYQTLL